MWRLTIVFFTTQFHLIFQKAGKRHCFFQIRENDLFPKKKKILETKNQDEMLKYLLASLMYKLAHTYTHRYMYRAIFLRKLIKTIKIYKLLL